MSKGKHLGTCNTCGSEIVELVNDGHFDEGECEACEYHRYRTQAPMLEALHFLLQQTVDMDVSHGIGLTEGEQEARSKALAVIAEAEGSEPRPTNEARSRHVAA